MYLETFIAMLESGKEDTKVEYTKKVNKDGTITIQLDIDRWVSHYWTFNSDGELIKIEGGMG